MNQIEETLWSYIDGTLSPEDHQQLTTLIGQDERYRLKYQELVSLNAELSAIELDEPPMAFTYNVMENIRKDQAAVPLRATINKRIIWGISIFFVLTIVILLAVTFTKLNWQPRGAFTQVSPALKLANLRNIFSAGVIKGFFFFDIVLALFLTDILLRKRIFYKPS